MGKDQEIQTQTPAGALSTVTVTTEQYALVKSVIMFPGATDNEMALFIFHCQRLGIHPLDKMIHPVKYGGDDPKMVFISSIDYFRSAAEETDEYDGQDEPEFEGTCEQNPDWPELARVRIYRKGFSRPFIGIARWKEFYPGDKKGAMWRKMPHNMLAKCAESQAFRKAFPKKFNEMFTPEEMEQAAVDPKEKSKDRSASIRSTGSHTQEGSVVDAETVDENPLDREITEILSYLADGEWDKMDAMLKETSKFPKAKGSKDMLSFGMDKLQSVSADWKNRVLVKLRKYKTDTEALRKELAGTSEEPPPATDEQPQGEVTEPGAVEE
jgi:phage recombination protein Bet